MKIKREYHDRVINVTDPFIPKGVNYRLGDLRASQVRAFYAQGLINDELLEPKKARKPKKNDLPKEDNENEE